MITVFGYPNSRATRITWMLEELGQTYDYFLVDLPRGGGKEHKFLAINPAGKVPAINIDELVMSESAAIVSHLADCYPEAGLIPAAGSSERARYEQWSYFAVCELEQPLWNIGKHSFALPEDKRMPALLQEIVPWEFQRALKLLSEGLGDSEYLLGDTFSGVDILSAQTLVWALAFKQPVEQANLQAYLERCQNRPAYERARQREKLEAER